MDKGSIVSVVIPTKNGAESLSAVLDALMRQRTKLDVEIIAADSGSNDGTLDLLKRYPVELHQIQPAAFNHGGTRNLGIQLSRGDPVILLTQDAEPIGEDFIDNIVRPFADERIAGVYGRQTPRPSCDVVRRRELESWLTGRPESAVSVLDGVRLADLPPFEQYTMCNFDNVCSAVRRKVWEQVPFPHTDFAEDLAWGKSVIEAGWAIAYEPKAAVVHSHRRSIFHEHARTRICHRELYKLFCLNTLPSGRDVWRASVRCLRNDLPYVWRHVQPIPERFRQLFRIAGLSILSPYAQHRGYCDALSEQPV